MGIYNPKLVDISTSLWYTIEAVFFFAIKE